MKTQYLINETPLMVLPSLMKAFNGNYTKALILQQIHFMCSWPKSGVEHDGERWVWFTYEEFAEQYMPWLSARNIQKNVLELEKEGLLVSTTRLRDSWDNTKFYRADESAILRMVEGEPQDVVNDGALECTVEATPQCTVGDAPECTVLYTDHSSKQGAEHRSPAAHRLGKRQRRPAPEHMRIATLHGLESKEWTRLVDAVLDAAGKKHVADLDGVFGERELSAAQECAASLIQLGVHSPEQVHGLATAFADKYPKFGKPAYSQLLAAVDYAKATTPKPLPAGSKRNSDGSVTTTFVPPVPAYAA